MKLRCQLKGIKCPRYEHHGTFRPDDFIVKKLLPDLNRCADCMANAYPKLLDIRDDLLQRGCLVLLEKGTAYDPKHPSGANFGTFIRPRICGALMDAKAKEIAYREHERPYTSETQNDSEAAQDSCQLAEPIDPYAEFEDELIEDIALASALPVILKTLTPRQRDIYTGLCENQKNCEIANNLGISEARVSLLVKKVKRKILTTAGELGLLE